MDTFAPLYSQSGDRLADFLIIGAAKTGTTSLYLEFLKSNRAVVPNLEETHFFVAATNPEELGEGQYGVGQNICRYADYAAAYREAPTNTPCGEKSVAYMALPGIAIDNIQRTYADPGQVKIIAVVRDPVERAYSHYLMHVRDGLEPLPFERAISPELVQTRRQNGYSFFWDYFGLSLYADSLLLYLDSFDHVLVLQNSFLRHNWPEALLTIERFIRVPGIFAERDHVQRLHNMTGTPKTAVGKTMVYLAYRDNPVRRTLKYFMPKSLKSNIKHWIGSTFLSRPTISADTDAQLRERFSSDQDAVAALLGPGDYAEFHKGKRVDTHE